MSLFFNAARQVVRATAPTASLALFKLMSPDQLNRLVNLPASMLSLRGQAAAGGAPYAGRAGVVFFNNFIGFLTKTYSRFDRLPTCFSLPS